MEVLKFSVKLKKKSLRLMIRQNETISKQSRIQKSDQPQGRYVLATVFGEKGNTLLMQNEIICVMKMQVNLLKIVVYIGQCS